MQGRNLATSSIFFIPANTKVPDGAYDFLTFITSAEGTMIHSVSHNGFPTHLSNLKAEEFTKGYDADVFAAIADSPNLFAPPSPEQAVDYGAIIGEQVELAMYLKQTPEQALENIHNMGMDIFK